ncbi:hypothetical protein EYW49_14405 [Siculibacillus lacustris]|uniref:Sulfur globule protein n=1 Tax=Siculibacillus lacustris TaxID=1549641 RepID=A0A4Q9VLF4_9HYPH|nr:hypothetical protein [Siculibacillus lacustris]TBW36293.1 hypothetical protein EYW49_14405 [Siculibacillus lacustris]
MTFRIRSLALGLAAAVLGAGLLAAVPALASEDGGNDDWQPRHYAPRYDRGADGRSAGGWGDRSEDGWNNRWGPRGDWGGHHGFRDRRCWTEERHVRIDTPWGPRWRLGEVRNCR